MIPGSKLPVLRPNAQVPSVGRGKGWLGWPGGALEVARLKASLTIESLLQKNKITLEVR
jgi:hypothetical protein